MGGVISAISSGVSSAVKWTGGAVTDAAKWTAGAAKTVAKSVSKDGVFTNFVQDYVPGGGFVTAAVHAAAGNTDYAEYAAVKGVSTTITTAASVAGSLGGPAGAALAGAAGAGVANVWESSMRGTLQSSVKNKIDPFSVQGLATDMAFGAAGSLAGAGAGRAAGKIASKVGAKSGGNAARTGFKATFKRGLGNVGKGLGKVKNSVTRRLPTGKWSRRTAVASGKKVGVGVGLETTGFGDQHTASKTALHHAVFGTPAVAEPSKPGSVFPGPTVHVGVRGSRNRRTTGGKWWTPVKVAGATLVTAAALGATLTQCSGFPFIDNAPTTLAATGVPVPPTLVGAPQAPAPPEGQTAGATTLAPGAPPTTVAPTAPGSTTPQTQPPSGETTPTSPPTTEQPPPVTADSFAEWTLVLGEGAPEGFPGAPLLVTFETINGVVSSGAGYEPWLQRDITTTGTINGSVVKLKVEITDYGMIELDGVRNSDSSITGEFYYDYPCESCEGYFGSFWLDRTRTDFAD